MAFMSILWNTKIDDKIQSCNIHFKKMTFMSKIWSNIYLSNKQNNNLKFLRLGIDIQCKIRPFVKLTAHTVSIYGH